MRPEDERTLFLAQEAAGRAALLGNRNIDEGFIRGAAKPDYSVRADPASLPERMDEPCTYEEFRECVRDLGSVNRWTFGYRPTLKFLTRIADAQSTPRSLRIVDVGSGGGDALRRISRWARRRRLAVELTGIDLNPYATRAAKEFSSRAEGLGGICWLTGNALDEPSVQQADVVISSLVTHHMGDAEIVGFLRWMERTATRGWFINDLQRSGRASLLFRVMAELMRWHPFIHHDGPVSFRRAFCVEDWRRLLAAAEIPAEAVALTKSVPGRLCVARLR